MTKSLFSPAYQRLRDWLVDARHGSGLTQAQLADTLGRPQSFVSKYERGERRLDFVEVLEIADVLGADVGNLVTQVRRRG
jgi:transcriptional regulator with XRE-family HTH domain